MITEVRRGRPPGAFHSAAGLALVTSMALTTAALAGCAVSTVSSAGPGDPGQSAKSTHSASEVPVEGSAPAGSALQALASIVVKGRAPTTGYSREEFGGAWRDTDRNGCDQRNDVLRRDLIGETLKPGTHGCIVLSGTLVDRYTGTTISFRKQSASEVHIDHVVALQNAWVTGAFRWTEKQRTSLATDPLNLLAVGASVNESKGSGDAATWLPRKSYRCAYVARQVAVKVKYQAWMTAAEHAAIKRVLSTCSDQKMPREGPIQLGEGSRSGSAGSAARGSGGSSGGEAAAQGTVHPGSFCSPGGATGTSKTGTAMICSVKGGERARWRSS